ncbi:MAG: tetratricopeptide repeat protein [Nitrospinae bacterium]|nr:tetratricopeptide repeat protein [Nitrospinota bacterium]
MIDLKEFGVLAHSLLCKDSGLFLIETGSREIEEDIMRRIRIEAGKGGKRVVDADLKARNREDGVSEFLREIIKKQEADILFVYNLDSGLPGEEEKKGFIRRLNYSREPMHELDKEVVFFASPDMSRLLQKYAPDLYHWISQKYSFQQEGIIASETGTTEAFRQDRGRMERFAQETAGKKKETEFAIKMYEKQLRKGGEEGLKEDFLVPNIMEPLAGLYYETGNYERAIKTFNEVMPYYRGLNKAEKIGSLLNNLGNAYCDLPTGDRVENLENAIHCFKEALAIYSKNSFPVQYATTMNNLGIAYSNLPAGDRGENLENAIHCYKEALAITTKDSFPVDYAATMNNLGNAYWNLPTGDRGENLENAIHCYKEALSIRTKDSFPVQYAMTMNNLGSAYSDLPTGDRGENLENAIHCFKEALGIRTKDLFPVDYAMTMNNLGTAYSNLPAGDRGENLENAIHCFKEALAIRTKDLFPVDYAMTMNNLGTAYENLFMAGGKDFKNKAIEAYREALTIYSKIAFPVEYKRIMERLKDLEIKN